MLKQSSLHQLKDKKNLLAFSAGVDSSALFFILLQNNIKFDIAIVDYGTRVQSKEEVTYAKDLSSTYHLKCHLLNAEKIQTNFEYRAREIRYDFFEKLIKNHTYENLLTAHHLGDRFEWMLMQFCKGSGCVELAGMTEIQKRENYTLIRPLLHLDKQELLIYLRENSIKYFEDATNQDENIKRNEFRHKYSNPLLQQHLKGIKKSFEYIDKDVTSILIDVELKTLKDFAYFTSSKNIRNDVFHIDKYLKSQKYMMSSSERSKLQTTATLIVGRKFLINQTADFVFIIPYSKNKLILTSTFKDECRILKIEPKLRSYLAQNPDIFLVIKGLLSTI